MSSPSQSFRKKYSTTVTNSMMKDSKSKISLASRRGTTYADKFNKLPNISPNNVNYFSQISEVANDEDTYDVYIDYSSTDPRSNAGNMTAHTFQRKATLPMKTLSKSVEEI